MEKSFYSLKFKGKNNQIKNNETRANRSIAWVFVYYIYQKKQLDSFTTRKHLPHQIPFRKHFTT
jgi:hypothetical protein